jgi:hypothetical protein
MSRLYDGHREATQYLIRWLETPAFAGVTAFHSGNVQRFVEYSE